MSIEQQWSGDWQAECDNVLPGQGYRWVQSNGGMVISRESVLMRCLVRDIDGYRAMLEW